MSWLEEVFILHANSSYGQSPFFDWMASNPNVLEHFVNLVEAHARQSDLFLSLSNTSMAVYHAWEATKIITTPGSPGISSRSLEPHYKGDFNKLSHLRHPDPNSLNKLTVTEPDLQMRGSWEKIPIPKSKSPPPRVEFASFFEKGFFYVLGGEKNSGKMDKARLYDDFWRLDLSNFAVGWEKLPSLPSSFRFQLGGHQASVYAQHSRVYVFNGSSHLCYYDLVTEKWDRVQTGGMTRYPNDRLTDFSMVICSDRLYIFGGTHDKAVMGCDEFQSLSLETMRWDHISGTISGEIPSWNSPGPRRHAACWTSKGEVYIMGGEADRLAGSMAGLRSGATRGYGYDDLWAYKPTEKGWRKLLIKGNRPCPRSEMSVTYNPVLGKTICFGGYSPSLPTAIENPRSGFTFSYYSDTFILDEAASDTKWRQVLTSGFPTYRAQAKLHTDPATGNIYLFGGYTNSDYIPGRKEMYARFHSDLFRLKLDCEGGGFEDVDWAEESKTARAGPWRRCFSCGSATRKKCGGSCKGRVSFCDVECLREGWKEHKETMHCRK
ncbi:hypothetical protein C8J56DRAFT_448047 [Mycena floridula]|nr:hypothetical protein C8J56DRAFT_448047 [Mycena floridula]